MTTDQIIALAIGGLCLALIGGYPWLRDWWDGGDR